MKITIDMLVGALGGAVQAVHGPTDRDFSNVAPIDRADAASLSFCSKAPPACERLMRETASRVILCGAPQVSSETRALGKTLVVVADPRLAMVRVINRWFAPGRPPAGVHPSANVDPRAQVAPTASIGPFTHVGAATVGADTVVQGHAYIGDGVRIGARVIVQAGAIVGADGFGYQRNERGELERFPHVGGVLIEDDVEIGACSCVDRGALGDTVLRQGCKIDNLVHIAHNVTIGRHALLIAHAMVGGSTEVGEGAWVAPSATLRDGIRIGHHATVGLGALVVKDVPDGAVVMGAPARPMSEYKALLAALRTLEAHE
jgi:UDP-3-O-[3-hydroxymyristoyl] glucosamine N-acyltransferase